LTGWGAKSSATVLSRYGRIEDIPADSHDWDVKVRGASKLAMTLKSDLEDALLFRELATLVDDCVTLDSVGELRWTGPTDDVEALTETVDAPDLRRRSRELSTSRS